MTRHAYYNENNPKAAATLRELINAGHIAPGIVDERSIEDVYPSDLRGFTQCHFFAGIGVWSYALRLAGWSDDRPVWTGSCPCQPFSAAGEGTGFADERHLWPAWHHLVGECRPADLLGEQVASKDADPWIDLVHTDMEALGYAFGALPFPAAGVGAPNIRDRLYWVANASGSRLALGKRLAGVSRKSRRADARQAAERIGVCGAVGLGHANGDRTGRDGRAIRDALVCCDGELGADDVGASSRIGGVADANGRYAGAERQQRGGEQRQQPQDGGRRGMAPGATFDATTGAGPTNGLWRDADWLLCRDGKWRPVEPGTFPLAHGAPERVGRLHGCGNAINAKAAQAFIEAVMEAEAA